MNRKDITARSLLALMLLAAAAPRLMAQATGNATQQPAAADEEETIELSPFTITAAEDEGNYRATATLAGSRIRTELKDVASSISVVTKDFLRDTGARNNQDLLVYTTGTEVGGVYGNYAGVGSTFIDGASESSNFARPNSNTRVRGLDSADNTRELFQSYIPWDSYNVGRVDLQRGPNSILFGFGSPAGIINTSLNGATFGKTTGNVENRLGSFGSVRWSFDYNHVLLPRELALRISALDDDTKYRQDPAYNHDQRLYGAVRYAPKLLQLDGAKTTIRANFEHGKVRANRPRILPPIDRITPFFDPNAVNKQTWDPYYAWAAGIIPYSSSATIATEKKNPWIGQSNGTQGVTNPIFVYNSPNANQQAYAMQAAAGTHFGIGANGSRDGSIDGFPYGSNIGIQGFREVANNYNRMGGSVLFPAADKGFWKNKSITDPTIFDFYNQLIDGPNKREWQNWDAYNIAIEQTLFDDRLGVELVYDRQKYDDGQSRNINDPFISVDIRKNLLVYPGAYADLARANPDAGRAYIGSGTKNGGNSEVFTDRENLRATVFGVVRASDFLESKTLANILGRHVITGVYAKEKLQEESRNWVRFAVDNSWSAKVGATDPGLTGGDINVDWITYLSDPLFNRNSASGLHLSRITAEQSPHGAYGIPYFNSRWAATGVDPSATWFNPARGPGNNPPGENSTQSENPRNYVGWVTDQFTILNADRGDRSRLYTDVNKLRRTTDSKAFTWQAYLWEDTIVGTVGWRRDTQKIRSGASSANTEPGKVALMNPDLDEGVIRSEGDSTSWGIVVHTPRPWRDRLPYNTNVSLTYSDGRNSRVENRYSFMGNALPNATGRTKDIGVVISTLDDRLQFKVTKYKTTVKDANLSSVTTEVSTLGNNTYYLRNLEAWGTATVMAYLRGRAGEIPGDAWFWNWAHVDSGWTAETADPNGAPFLNHPSTAKQTAAINSWLQQLMPESWFRAYGFNINYAAAKAGDFRNAFPGWNASGSIGGIQPSGGGRINGVWPTGTADNESEGWEYEIVGQPTKNLNISINASKTTAAQTALGADLTNFIEMQYAKYQSPAGDLRLWWGGGDTFRKTYTENIWSAYQFQLKTNGKMVPEMAPWRFNTVANYNFDRGALKGANLGIGYRWQDGRILGYQLNDAKDNLDINRPYWSKSEDHIDAWVGYQRKLSEKLTWRIQLNLRNIGEDAHLSPISIQPDGSPAAFKIQEGMTWQLTNTLSF
jgi:outer membrane receptor protein involved in Fe transport